MENATKALLIAASVLIVIMLITVGIKIFNSTSSTTTQAEDVGSSISVQTFNAQFTAYEGSQQVTNIKNLVVAVNSSNKVNTNHKVEMKDRGNICVGHWGHGHWLCI